jgi:hypothetical protein
VKALLVIVLGLAWLVAALLFSVRVCRHVDDPPKSKWKDDCHGDD